MVYYRLNGGLKLQGAWRPYWVSTTQTSYWTSAQIIGGERVPTGATTNSRVGSSIVGFNDNIAVAGQFWSSFTGRVWLYSWDGSDYGSEVILNGESQSSSQFGSALAFDTDVLVVGSQNYTDLNNVVRGAVYVYRKNPIWDNTYERVLCAEANKGNNIQFGKSVAISGNYMAVGAPSYDTGGQSDLGLVELYEYNGTSWNHIQSIYGPVGSQFGYSVSLYGDTLAVGAPYESSKAGAVYIYTRSGSTFGSQVRIAGSYATGGFGYSLKLASATDLAIGSPGDPALSLTSTTASLNGGRIYVYSDAGGGWLQDQEIRIGMNTDNYFINDAEVATTTQRDQMRVGYSVDYRIEPEGTHSLIYGAIRNPGGLTGSSVAGATFISEKVNGTWQKTVIPNSKMPVSGLTNGTYFGYGCAFDGKRVAATGIGSTSNRGGWRVFQK